MQHAENIEQYLMNFPDEIKERLEIMRKTIMEAAPEASEIISYGMPAYKQTGILVYFAGYKNHIGFYPTSSGVAAFQSKIEKYKSSKGAIQFRHDQELPLKLIAEIVKFRLKLDLEKLSKFKKNI